MITYIFIGIGIVSLIGLGLYVYHYPDSVDEGYTYLQK